MPNGLDAETHAYAIVDAIRRVVGGGTVGLHDPVFRGNELRYLAECIETLSVSSNGEFVRRFEQELARRVGAAEAVAVVNGTAALQVALQLVGVRADDEVIVPTLSFVATANAVSFLGAVPHFADSESTSLGMDAAKLRTHLRKIGSVRGGVLHNRTTGRRLRAVVPMHTFGHPADIGSLVAVAEDFGLAVIEDAAEALGSTVGGRHVGTAGVSGILSFNGNKTITTGGGGALVTNDESFARRARHITSTAKVPHPWAYQHDEIGYNFRMPNLNAALGCAQLERLDVFVEAQRALFGRYQQEFAGFADASVLAEPPRCRSNYWLQALVLSPQLANQRDTILRVAHERGLRIRPIWGLLHEQAPYTTAPRMDVSTAVDLAQRVINLPSSAFL